MASCTVIIPCFNERATVYRLLERVAQRIDRMPDFAWQVLVVDDGSTDESRREIERFLADHPEAPVRLLVHEKNRGKGAAIRTALETAECEIVLIQDADLEYDPEDYEALLRPIEQGLVPVVYGSRWLAPEMPISGTLYYIGGWLENWVLHLLYRTNISDIATCYKAFRTDVARDLDLSCTGFEFCPEITAKLLNRNVPIIEVPIRYAPRTKSEGKKIRWTDLLVGIGTLVRVRLGRQ